MASAANILSYVIPDIGLIQNMGRYLTVWQLAHRTTEVKNLLGCFESLVS